MGKNTYTVFGLLQKETMLITDIWKKYKIHIVLLSIALITSIIIIGCLVAPTLFYDQWIWKYYWGPVVADTLGHTAVWNGVEAQEGYTLISEITYGIILIAALYGIYQLLKKLHIIVDWRFCLALLPFILFGPVTRVLEDTEYFTEPFVYWFISPLIYLQIAAYALFFLVVGYLLTKKVETKSSQYTTLFGLLIIYIVFNALYGLLWFLEIPYAVVRIEPLILIVLSFVSAIPFLYQYIKKQRISINAIILSGGLLFLLPTFYLIGWWLLGNQWSTFQDLYLNVLFLILILVSVITCGVYLVGRAFPGYPSMKAYMLPLNLAMVFGHMIDGITSYISIYDPLNMGILGYEEKHPASNFLMQLWPPLFPIVKFFLIIAIIYLFDNLYREELKSYQRLVNLLKIGILILGFSPGVRDLLRVTMGV